MTTATLPRVVSVDSDHRPVYHLRTATDDVTLKCFTPHLPGENFHWASAEQVDEPTIVLTVAVVAELLAHDLTVDPDALTAEQVADVLDRELTAVGCDMRRCCADVAGHLYDYPDTGRYDRLVLLAGRLLGVSV